jgi:hypothetical protein
MAGGRYIGISPEEVVVDNDLGGIIGRADVETESCNLRASIEIRCVGAVRNWSITSKGVRRDDL